MLKFSCAQIPARIGDFDFNLAQIIEAARNAQQQGAHVLVTPELSITGYLPEDLLFRPAFRAASEAALGQLCTALRAYPDLYVLVGVPTWFTQGAKLKVYNSVVVLQGGQEVQRIHKQKLPNQAVFDELRYFTEGPQPELLEIQGVKIGVLVCEDAWHPEPAAHLKSLGAQLLLVANASPFHTEKVAKRLRFFGARVQETGLPILSINRVGGQDELIFGGASFALQKDNTLAMQLPMFVSVVHEAVFDIAEQAWHKDMVIETPCEEEEAYRAMVMGVRDYVHTTGFKKVCLGLSGGVDSALTLAVAVDALGAERVRAVMMASPYTAQMSLDDSREMVARLGVRYDEIPIEPAMQVFAQLLEAQFAGLPADTTEENLQSRIRGMILMALSNKTGAIVLTTGNKSEMATGYATLYGDMAGGFAVLKDVYKSLAFRLARWRNTLGPVIPQNIIDRPPSAELKHDQTDQDSLPPYEMLDAIIEAYMERDQSPREIIAAGFPEAEVRRTVSMLTRSEYKRRQAPVGVRVTQRGFGKDWRYPITSRYQDEF